MKRLHKAVVLLLVAASFLCALSSCSSDRAPVWVSYKDTVVRDYSYRYWLAQIKSAFVTGFEDITDTLECWNTKTTDASGSVITRGEYVERYAVQYVKNVVIELQWFKDYGLRLSDEDEKAVDDYLDEIVYYRYQDSKSLFGAALKDTYGITLTQLRDTLLLEKKIAAVESYLFGSGGIMSPSDGELEEYYNTHYVRILPIVVYTETEYVTDENGDPVTDEAGAYVKKTLTEDEKKEKRKKAEAVYSLAKEGEDFLSLSERYGEGASTYREGFYFSSDDIYSISSKNGVNVDVLSSIGAMQVGSVEKFEIGEGAVLIVKRAALEERAYGSSKYSDFFSGMTDHVATRKMRSMIEERLDDVSVNDELYALKVVDIKKGIL